MTPVDFPESNTHFNPPIGMEETVEPMRAWKGSLVEGLWDGQEILIVAHRPNDEERKRIAEGGDIYVSFLGHQLVPHAVNAQFPVELRHEA